MSSARVWGQKLGQARKPNKDYANFWESDFLKTLLINKSKATLALFLSFLLLVSFSLAGCTQNTNPPSLPDPKLSSPNIITEGTLTVGVNTSLSPLAGMGNNKIIGIDVDIAAALADYLGLKLQIIDTGSSPASALSGNTVDIALGVDSTDTPKGARLTESYIDTGVALFVPESSSASVPEAGATPKISAQTSSKSSWAVTNTFGNASLVGASDLNSAISSLTSNQATYLASDAVIGKYATTRANVKTKIVALLDNKSGYCVAVSESKTELYSKINEALSEIKKNGTIDVIQKKWLGDVVDLSSVSKVQKSSTTSDEPISANSTTDNSTNSNGTSNNNSTGSTNSENVATDASAIRSSR